jgi:hypothetical protein
MLTAVNFDHKAMLLADEINDVRADRKLAMEFASRQPAVPQS